MRISDWSSDVCSSDLGEIILQAVLPLADQDHVAGEPGRLEHVDGEVGDGCLQRINGVQRIIFGAEQAPLLGCPGGEDERAVRLLPRLEGARDRKSVVSGTSVSVLVNLGGSRIIKKNIYLKSIRYSYF